MKRAHKPATRRSELRRLGDRCPQTMEDQKLLLDKNGLSDHRTDATRTCKSGKSND